MLTSRPASPERPSVDQKKSTHAKFCASHSHEWLGSGRRNSIWFSVEMRRYIDST